MRFTQWICSIFLIVVTLSFSRVALDSFDVTKALIVLVAGSMCLPYLAIRCFGWRVTRVQGGMADRIAVAAFVACLFLSLLGSDFWATSFWGQYQRYTGIFTILACIAVCAVVRDAVEGSDREWLSQAIVFSQAIANGYGLLQWTDKDPWKWESASFGRLVFSTFGNPNTAAAFTAVTLPIAIGSMALATRWKRVIPTLTVSSSLFLMPIYGSFQGFVGFGVGLLALVAIVRQSHGAARTYLLSLWVVVTGIFSVVLTESWWCLLGATSLGLVLNAAIGNDRKIPVIPKGLKMGLGALLTSLVIIGVVAFRTNIQSQISDGLSERRFFYSAGWEMFKKRPVFGWGVETYGFWFTRFRSLESATTLEGSITSSIHSVPFGLLVGGGFFLGASFAFIVYRYLILPSVMWLKDPSDVGRAYFLIAGWVWLVVSLVSVESVHLFFLLAFVLGGCALTNRSSGGRARTKYLSSSKPRDLRTFWLLGFVAALLLLPLSTRYFRADSANLSGLRHLGNGEIEQASKHLEDAVGLAPWNGEYRARLAFVKNQQGMVLEAATLAKQAAEDSNFPNSISVDLALLALNGGDLESGVEILKRALANDPYAPGLRNQVETVLNQVINFSISEGNEKFADDIRVWMNGYFR